jgi:hypothetical protein
MILSVRKWAGRALFIVIFCMLAFIAAGGYRFLADTLSPLQSYRVPQGNALKVFVHEPGPPDSGSMSDRLRWFFYYGE